MNTITKLFFISICFLISSCATENASAPASAPVAVWDIAYKGEDFRSNSKPSGIILFSQNSKRKSLICDAFIQNIPNIGLVSSTLDVRITYWPSSNTRQQNNLGQLSCDNLLQSYDYIRAEKILNEINNNRPVGSVAISGDGPIFVGFSGTDDGTIVVIDGSTRTDSEMKSLVDEWKGTIIQDVTLWNKAKQATVSQSGKVSSTNSTPDSSQDDNGFWSQLWQILKPAIKYVADNSGPIIIWVIKLAIKMPA